MSSPVPMGSACSGPFEKTDEPLIIAEGLTKTFGRGPDAVVALTDVHLTVHRGEFVTVVGPSGCGKSTLLFLLGLMMAPTAGRLSLAGRDVGGLADSVRTALRRELLGFVFQRFNLVPVLSALENVRLPLAIRGERDDGRAESLLAAVGLAEKLNRRPTELSIGQQQRVALARALVHRPSLLLADEPTGNLDSRSGQAVLELLNRLHREHRLTVVMITHNPEAARHASRVLSLADGRIVADTAETASPSRLAETEVFSVS